MEDTGRKDGRSVSRRGKANARGKGRAESSVLTETQKLIALLKESKVEHYKADGVEIKFSPLAFLPKEALEPKSEATQEDIDELLFYSAPDRG